MRLFYFEFPRHRSKYHIHQLFTLLFLNLIQINHMFKESIYILFEYFVSSCVNRLSLFVYCSLTIYSFDLFSNFMDKYFIMYFEIILLMCCEPIKLCVCTHDQKWVLCIAWFCIFVCDLYNLIRSIVQ